MTTRKPAIWLVPLAFFILAGVALTISSATVASILAIIGFVSVAVIVVRQRRTATGPPPELTPDEADSLREQRDKNGAADAIKRLRKMYPQLSLVEAVKTIQNL